MGRSKQNKNQQSKDGKHRKETKEERRARLQSQEEAREQCLKILPVAGGIMLLFLITFGLYVRSVPPRQPTIPDTPLQQVQYQGGIPEFMHVDTEPLVKEALEEASQVLKDLDSKGDEDDKPTIETIEL